MCQNRLTRYERPIRETGPCCFFVLRVATWSELCPGLRYTTWAPPQVTLLVPALKMSPLPLPVQFRLTLEDSAVASALVVVLLRWRPTQVKTGHSFRVSLLSEARTPTPPILTVTHPIAMCTPIPVVSSTYRKPHYVT